MRRLLIGLLASFALLPTAMSAANPGDQKFDAIVDGAGHGFTTATTSVAVVRAGRLIYRKNLGRAQDDTSFAIGSLSKMFTAVSIVQLAERHRLSLDEPIARWFPTYPNATNITIRELLEHRSGIPDYLSRAYRSGKINAAITVPEIIAETATWTPDFAPDRDWNYSNTGYLLAASIVERVSGTTLADYEQRAIFAVAQMSRTSVGSVPHGTRIAVRDGRVPFGVGPDPRWFFGCGDIISTARDLAAFDIALFAGKLVHLESLARMTATVTPGTLVTNVDDGMGFFIRVDGQRAAIGHHGGIPGYSADDQMILKGKDAVVVLSTDDVDPDALLNPLLDALESPGPKSTREPVDPDPVLTADLLRTLKDFSAGHVDRDAFVAEVKSGVLATAASRVAADAELGPHLTALHFQTKAYDSGYRLLSYKADFGATSKVVRLVIDAAGKILTLAFV